MSYLKIRLTILCCFTILISCKKEVNINEYSANVTLVHAANDIGDLKINFTGKHINFETAFMRSYDYYNGRYFSAECIGVPVNRNIPLTVVKASDTLDVIYDRSISFNPGDLYTLYIAGQAEAIDTMLVKEESLPIHIDSTMSVRFVNLAPDSGPLSINLSGEPLGSEIENLNYKNISSFKTYQTRSLNDSYVFEFHNQTGDIIAVYSFDNPSSNRVPKFKNISLVLKGMATSFYQVVRVDY